MAENNTPPQPPSPDFVEKTDQATNANQRLAASFVGIGSEAEIAHGELGKFSGILSNAQTILQGFESRLQNFGMSMKMTGSLTEQQTEQFGLLTTVVFGARDAFQSFGSGDMGKNFSGFKDQVNDLANGLINSGGGVAELADLAKNAFGVVMPDAAKKSVEAAKGFLASLATSADNALRLQNGIVQLAGKTGGLNEIYAKAGENLENMNAIMRAHENMMTDTMRATGLNQQQVEDWYSSLGSIPGALQQTVTTGSDSSKTMSLLTASIKAATGAGRQQSEVMNDMRDAFKNYGISGQQALDMTIQLSDISNSFGIDIDTVKGAFNSATQEILHFAAAGENASRMATGMQAVMKQWVGGLMDAGMSARDATNAAAALEANIGKLTVAQKGFMSAQTGGPGGLLGGMEIDKMMMSGDFEGVMKKQMETMKKLIGGPVMTLSDVKTEQDASKMQRQIALMQQGPLGGMIKNPQDAYKMFDFMAGKTQGMSKTEAGKQLTENFLGTAIDKGSKWEEKSYTQLTAMRNHLRALQASAEVSNLGFLQKGATAAATSFRPDQTTEAQRRNAEALHANMQQGTARSGQGTKDYRTQMKESGSYVDQGGAFAATAIQDIGEFFKQLPDAIRAPMDALKKAMVSGDDKAIRTELQTLQDDIKAARDKAKKTTGAKRDELLQKAQQEENALRQAHSYYSRAMTEEGRNPLPRIAAGALGETPVTPPANNVRNAPRPTASPATQGRGGGGTPQADVNVAQVGNTGRFNVNVVVKVEEKHLNGTAITPASNTPP